jgi:uncharacterized FlgJ-related protein
MPEHAGTSQLAREHSNLFAARIDRIIVDMQEQTAAFIDMLDELGHKRQGAQA